MDPPRSLPSPSGLVQLVEGSQKAAALRKVMQEGGEWGDSSCRAGWDLDWCIMEQGLGDLGKRCGLSFKVPGLAVRQRWLCGGRGGCS